MWSRRPLRIFVARDVPAVVTTSVDKGQERRPLRFFVITETDTAQQAAPLQQ